MKPKSLKRRRPLRHSCRPEVLEQRLLLTGFTAFNSFYPSTTNPNTTNYADVSGTDAAGPLRDSTTGNFTDAAVSVSNLGAVFGGNGTNPFSGTDADDVFGDDIQFTGSQRRTIELFPGQAYQYTFEDLDPGALYSFAGTAIRGNASYTNRWTLVELSGAVSFEIDHSDNTGIYRNGLAANQVALWSGDNAKPGQGAVVAWTDIDPGTDGIFHVVSSHYTGSVPRSISSGGTANGSKGYALSAVRLIEQEAIGPPALENQTFEVLATTANVGGELIQTGGQLPSIKVYYGTSDGGTNPLAWQNSVDVDSAVNFSTNLDDLAEDTTYFFRSFGEHSSGSAWATETSSFRTLLATPPVVDNATDFQIGATSAIVSGNVADTGNDLPIVSVFYGDEDGGTTPSGWDNEIQLGAQEGEFTVTLDTLSPNTEVYFTIRATNGKGTDWLDSSLVFQTNDILPLVINEFLADNATTLQTRVRSAVTESFRGDRITPDWIEIKAASSNVTNLSGYYLTDDPSSLRKWQFPVGTIIPQNESIVVFASGINIVDPELDELRNLHTNFQLSSAAGSDLILVDPNGEVVAAFNDMPQQLEDVSYGLGANGEARFFADTTPGEDNAFALPQAPTITVPSRTFTSSAPLIVEIEAASEAHTIHYTTNERMPTTSSPIYTEPLRFDRTTMLRAIAVGPNGEESIVVAESYIELRNSQLDDRSHLPLLIVETFGDSIPGTNSSFGDSFVGIIEPGDDGESALTDGFSLSTRAGIHVRGSSSAGFSKKQYRVEFRDEYDEDRKLNVLGMPREADWIFYGPSQFDRVLISNPLMFDLSNQINRYATRTRWVEAYFNGSYFGVYAIIETIERDDDRVDVEPLTSGLGGVPVEGGFVWKNDRGSAYVDPENVTTAQRQFIDREINRLLSAASSSNFKDPNRGYAAYADVNSFIDHNMLNLLAMNVDALRLSSFYYKTADGKLQAGPIWDFDRSLDSTDGRDNNPRSWFGTGDSTRYFEDSSRVMSWWPRMFQDPDFVQQYIDRWFDLRENEFSNENLIATIDKHASILGDAADRDYSRWSRSRYGDFAGEIDHLKDWLITRAEWIDSRWLAKPRVSVNLETVPTGTSVIVSSTDGEVYYMLDGTDPRGEDGRIRSEAIEAAGEFIQINADTELVARVYDRSHRGSSGYVASGDDWSAPLRITPTRPAASAANLAISEIHYNPRDADVLGGEENEDNDEFEFIEVVNTARQPIELKGVQFVQSEVDGEAQGIRFTFDQQLLAPGEAIVVVENVGAFQSRYGTEIRIAEGRDSEGDPLGQYGGKLSNGGERLKLIAANGETIRTLDYSDDWYESTDGDGRSLVNQFPRGATSIEQLRDRATWRPSGNVGGSPGSTALDQVDLVGDFNENGVVDPQDIDRLFDEVASAQPDAAFDLDSNQTVDANDVDYLLVSVLGTRSGDSNLDGRVDFQDFLNLSANFGRNDRTWETGDFDGDGAVNFTDFLLISANFGFVS